MSVDTNPDGPGPGQPQSDDDTDYWLEVKLYDLLRRLNVE